MTAVLARLLEQVATARVTIRVALLDKAFFSIPVMRLLPSREVPFVIPAMVRGRKPRLGVRATGLRAVRGRGAGRYGYTHAARGASVSFTAVVAHKSDRYRRTGTRRSKKLLYATWRVTGTPVAIRDRYRKRFGIESRYRQLGQVRPRTSTTNGVIRLLWVAVGLILAQRLGTVPCLPLDPVDARDRVPEPNVRDRGSRDRKPNHTDTGTDRTPASPYLGLLESRVPANTAIRSAPVVR